MKPGPDARTVALVTGAAGYLGRHFMERLLREKRVGVIALVRPGRRELPWPEDAVETIACDLTDAAGLEKAVAGMGSIDVVYHLAAATSGSHYEGMLNSVIATQNLLRALAGRPLRRFVLVSSFSVYRLTALRPWDVLDESCPVEDDLKRRDSYTITKVRQEHVVRDVCRARGWPLAVIRPGKIYGPGDASFPPQIGLAIPGMMLLCVGGRHLLPLTHVANTADAVFLAGFRDGLEREAVINVVDDGLPTQREYLEEFQRHAGAIAGYLRVPDWAFFGVLVRAYELASRISKDNLPPVVTRYRAANLWMPLRYDNARAKAWLGWRPGVPIRQGLPEALAPGSGPV